MSKIRRYLLYAVSSFCLRRAEQASRPRTAKTHFRVVLASFIGLGLHVGVWAVLIADLASALDLSAGLLGFALSLMTASGIAALLVGGRWADRYGRRSFLLLGVGGTGAFFLLLAAVNGYCALLLAFVFGGVCASSWDLSVNALGGDYEYRHGRRVMNLLHAGFSGGATAGALISGSALAAGADFRMIYSTVALALFILAAALVRLPLPDHTSEVAVDAPEGQGWSLPSLLLVPAIAVCVLVVSLAFSTDAALEGFLSIYLREVLSSGALLGGVGLSALYLAGTLGRLGSAAFLRRLGEKRLLAVSGLLAACGMGVVLATDMPSIAAGGLLLVGLALSPVAPVVFSIAARSTPGRSGQAISLVTVFGYLAFTVSPLMIGGVADLFSLRAAFLLLAFSCVGIALSARGMASKTIQNPESEE